MKLVLAAVVCIVGAVFAAAKVMTYVASLFAQMYLL